MPPPVVGGRPPFATLPAKSAPKFHVGVASRVPKAKQRCWCKRSEEAVILSQIGSIATYARLQPGFLLAAESRRPALRLVLEMPSQFVLEPSSSWLVLAPRSRVVSGVR